MATDLVPPKRRGERCRDKTDERNLPVHQPADEHTAAAEVEFATTTLQNLLHQIEVGNANAAAYPRPGRYTYLVSHAWADRTTIHLVYTAPPSDITWGLVRDTRESLIDPGGWNSVDDAPRYYYLLDLDENWPGHALRQAGDDPHAIRWRGDQLAGLPDRISDLPPACRYHPPPPDPDWIDHTPPVVIEPRRYADPRGPLPPPSNA